MWSNLPIKSSENKNSLLELNTHWQLSQYILDTHTRKVSVKWLVKSFPTINTPQSTYEGIQKKQTVSTEQGFSGSACALKQQKYWFQSVISLAIFHEKIQNLFFCWTFIHEYCTTPLQRRIPTDNYHRSKKQIFLTHQHKNHHTSQQQHNTTTTMTTTTTSTRIDLTMAKTQRLPKGASPQSSKRNVQDDNISNNNKDNDGSKRKSKKTKKTTPKAKRTTLKSKQLQ